ncbi:hypothetical protein QUF63_09080 [Anaerolineales bacterium HSG25]|nr:hypothetical protein [Anaerolineales bacterium HSG25]
MTAKTNPQDFVKEGFDAWKEYGETYTKFVVEATELSLNQSLAFRETVGQAWNNGLKQAQELSAKEQEVVLSNLEAVQGQTKAAYDRVKNMSNLA